MKHLIGRVLLLLGGIGLLYVGYWLTTNIIWPMWFGFELPYCQQGNALACLAESANFGYKRWMYTAAVGLIGFFGLLLTYAGARSPYSWRATAVHSVPEQEAEKCPHGRGQDEFCPECDYEHK